MPRIWGRSSNGRATRKRISVIRLQQISAYQVVCCRFKSCRPHFTVVPSTSSLYLFLFLSQYEGYGNYCQMVQWQHTCAGQKSEVRFLIWQLRQIQQFYKFLYYAKKIFNLCLVLSRFNSCSNVFWAATANFKDKTVNFDTKPPRNQKLHDNSYFDLGENYVCGSIEGYFE